MKLQDDSPMPFGKHKGVPMQDVPVGYLHYLWTTGKKQEPNHPVSIYIKSRLDALKMENKDLIW